ncbi:MAG: hypothetical protein NTZ41_04900 [Sphingobacteriales bacterium]|nr:hypothetical protein [Sphingobacteriales bacterium]
MKASSIKEIKSELSTLSAESLQDLCLLLARFKKENKELLSYQLFEAQDEEGYVQKAKETLDESFENLNIQSTYIAKKQLRKIIRIATKFSKYSDEKTTEITLYLYITEKMIASGLKIQNSQQINNLYLSLIKKIKAGIATLHEDLQYDFEKQLDRIMG